jgi:hypothetical protein
VSGPTTTLDRLSRVTPFGVKLWDPVTRQPVVSGVSVDVYPLADPQRRVRAFVNRVGTFYLPRLPGYVNPAFDFGSGEPEFWKRVYESPRPTYAIEVEDSLGNYQPFRFTERLPARWHVTPSCIPPSSPPADVVTMFPTVGRRVPAGMAVVRAELGTPTGPASWAVVDVQVGLTTPVRGLADREGRVAVIVSYPEPVASPARPASPPYATRTSLRDQHWPVRIAFAYEPQAPVPQIPDLCRTLFQAPAFAWTNREHTEPLGEQTLRYGEELILRGITLTPATSPPD